MPKLVIEELPSGDYKISEYDENGIMISEQIYIFRDLIANWIHFGKLRIGFNN